MMADDKGVLAADVERLTRENAALTQQLAATQQAIVAEKGPTGGTAVCYQRQGEGFCRPAVIASEGFTEVLKAPGGALARHALIEYGEAAWTTPLDAPAHMKAHSFQTDRPWDPSGKPETWHLPSECPRQNGPGCPYAKNPQWPALRKPAGVQAP
jgi:hypothetical protein